MIEFISHHDRQSIINQSSCSCLALGHQGIKRGIYGGTNQVWCPWTNQFLGIPHMKKTFMEPPHMNCGQITCSFSCHAQSPGRPGSVVKMYAFSDFDATHAKQGYRKRVVSYR